MLIQYDIDSGKVLVVSYGDDLNWTDEQVNSFEESIGPVTKRMVKLQDAPVGEKFYAYNNSPPTLEDFQLLGIVKDKSTVLANGTDIVTFTGVPPETNIWIDNASTPLVSDNTGVFEFASLDAGRYHISFRKYGYEWDFHEVIAEWP